jgi:hypothetical protein
MTLSKLLVSVMVPALLALGSPQEVFDLTVERIRPLRDQPGGLHIDAQGIGFRSKDGKTNIAIKMQDLREASVADPRALRFETYEVEKWKPTERRAYTFRSSTDAPLDALAQFLTSKVRRPVVGHYWQGTQFEVPAFHRRTFGGTNGTLRIGEESIQYLSDNPADARTWLYRDIETIGRPDAFRFRVTTSRETYVVELKDELPLGAYELAWSKVYNLERSSK